MQVGPLWSPAWLPPSSPSSSSHTQRAQHDQHAQRTQPEGHLLQQSNHSQSAAIPHESSSQPALPDTEDDSDFGSFTGNAAQPALWLPSCQVESAQDYIAKADQQVPAHFQNVISSTAGLGANRLGAVDRSTLKPAAAAATASVLQSMDRSAPISLGLFGEESYDDPVLELPDQAAVQSAAVDLQQEATPSGPRQMPSASAEQDATSLGQAPSSRHDFKPQHDFPPQFEFGAEHEFKSSSQHVHSTDPPTQSPSSRMSDAADDDFSPSWQQAGGEEDFGAAWHNQTSLVPGATGLISPAQTPQIFAATWPPLLADADSRSRQQVPGRQAVSGPVSLELFGMEEQEDHPLEVPLQVLTNTLSAPYSPQLVTVNGHQQPEDPVSLQQPAAAWQTESVAASEHSVLGRQTSPGPISLELFGMEETEDAPLELPVQATITVLPTPAPDTAGMLLHTGTLAFLPINSLVSVGACVCTCVCVSVSVHICLCRCVLSVCMFARVCACVCATVCACVTMQRFCLSVAVYELWLLSETCLQMLCCMHILKAPCWAAATYTYRLTAVCMLLHIHNLVVLSEQEVSV